MCRKTTVNHHDKSVNNNIYIVDIYLCIFFKQQRKLKFLCNIYFYEIVTISTLK